MQELRIKLFSNSSGSSPGSRRIWGILYFSISLEKEQAYFSRFGVEVKFSRNRTSSTFNEYFFSFYHTVIVILGMYIKIHRV